jgi:glycosyltransferase involved in cell wall biosynthesis
MPADRLRVLLIATHPVQYQSPIFRRMARHPRLDIHVAYCSLLGAEKALDPDFATEVQWDVPLLDGYPWTQVPNWASPPRPTRFWGIVNPGLWKIIRRQRFDAVVTYTGYMCASFWIVAAATKFGRVPFLFGTDATGLEPRSSRAWRASLKKLILPSIFRLATVVIVPSTAGVDFIRTLGIPASRIVLTPYTVDNDWWSTRAALVNRPAVRARWNVPENSNVVLFSAKMQPWKRPLDLLRAFANASVPDSYLVLAGDGPLRPAIESQAVSLGIADRVRLLGFVNQSGLPEVYASADLLVLASDYEPFGVVVNEAMLCGCAVAVSDRVGARDDLVAAGETGFVFPAGDVDALSRVLASAFADRDQLRQIIHAAKQRFERWSPHENVERMVEAITRACQSRA